MKEDLNNCVCSACLATVLSLNSPHHLPCWRGRGPTWPWPYQMTLTSGSRGWTSETISHLTQALEGEVLSWWWKIQCQGWISEPRPPQTTHELPLWKGMKGLTKQTRLSSEPATRKAKAGREKVTWRLSHSQEAKLFVSSRLLCISITNQLPS